METTLLNATGRRAARRSLALLAAAAFLAALPQAALAAGLSGRISGYVYDPTNSALSEVPLTLSSPSAQPVPVQRTTGEDGKFEFDNLPPAEDYVIEVNVPGFTPIKQTNIKVRLGQTTTSDVRLTVQTESQAVATYQIVEKVNPVLNPDSAQAGAVLSAEKVATTPIFHQAEGMAQQVAGTSGTSDGSGRIATRGGLRRYTKFYVDGLDTTDITDSGITSPINFDAVENFEILTGGMDAQYNSMGIVTNAVTKNGSNEWKYDVSLTAQPSFTAAKNKFPANQATAFGLYYNNPINGPDTTFYSPVVNIGGPIVKDYLWFFASYQQNFSGRENAVSVDGIQSNRNRQTTTSLGRFKLTWQPTVRDRVTAAFSIDRNIINNQQGDSTVSQDAESKLHRGGEWFVFNYDHNFSDNVLFQIQSGFTYKASDTDPIFDDFNTASHFDIDSRTTRFNNESLSASIQGNFVHESKYRFQFDPMLSWKLKFFGTHQMKAGFQFAYMYDKQTTGVSGNERFTDFGVIPDPTVNSGDPNRTHGLGCDPNNPVTFSTCDFRARFYDSNGQAQPLTTRAWARTYGMFIQDRWTVNKQLTIIPGIRMDIGRLQGEQGLITTPLVGFGPRLSATFDLFADRRTLLVAHYGRSNDVGNIFVAQHGNPALYSISARWNNTTKAFPDCPIDPQQNTFGTNCQYTGGASGRSFAAGQKPPFVDEVTAGIHHEVVPETVIGLDVTYRHYGNMWADEEINRIWDATGTKIVGYVNPALTGQSVFRTVARSDAYRSYQGMDLWVQGTPGRWDLLASYTLSFNQGTVGDYFDGYLNNSRMTQFYDGYTGDDRRHTIKGSVTYRTTFGLDLGMRMRYFTGAADWESFTNPGDSTQRIYRSPRGTGIPNATGTQVPNFNDPNSWAELRDPTTFIIDLQARYNLSQALQFKQAKAEIMLLVVNVLNDSTSQTLFDSYAATNNRFTLTNFHQSALSAELMLRFRN